MTLLTTIIEGAGDEAALPALISRATAELGRPVYTPHPIKVGSWSRLKKPGQLERFVELGMRPGVDGVLISVDLDDGCPAEETALMEHRRLALEQRFEKPVRIVLIRREYETWFLTQIQHLREVALEYDWDPDYTCANPDLYRDAKGQVSDAIRRSYKETTDQLRLTRYLDWRRLAQESRSFKKLLRDVLGLASYAELTALLEADADASQPA